MHDLRVTEAGLASPLPHVDFLGLPFRLLSEQQVVRLIIEYCGAPFRYVVTPNAYNVVAAHGEPSLLSIYRGAWLSLCGSQILRVLAALEGLALPVVIGTDLVMALLPALDDQNAESMPQHLLIVGPPTGAERKLRTAYPNLTIDVLPTTENLACNAKLQLAVARTCMDRHWEILLLCAGSPVNELIARHLAELGCSAGVALCVGEAIDFLADARVRARAEHNT